MTSGKRSSLLALTFLSSVLALLAAADIRLTDVSSSAEVDGDTYHSSTGHSLGVNWLDVDLDGWPDLFLVGGGPDRPPVLFRNAGDGSFDRVEHLLPALPGVEMSGSRFADIDRDGDLDIFIYTDNPTWRPQVGLNPLDGPANLLLRNLWVESGGAAVPLFEEVAEEAGLQDLASPALGDLPGHRAKTAAFLDYDRDGCVDLFVGQLVVNYGGHAANKDRLFRNRCDGTFEDVSASSGMQPGTDTESYRAALASGGFHLDDDLWPDLFVINVSVDDPSPYIDDFIFKNQGRGPSGRVTFSEVGIAMPGVGDDAQAGMGVDVADIDLDGDWDAYISDIYETTLDAAPLGNVFYRGSGAGQFEDNSAATLGIEAFDSWGVNFFDVDRDGFEDLFVSTISTSADEYLFRNDGLLEGQHQGFTNVAEQAGLMTGNSRGSAVADYDRDGDLDLAVVNQNGALQLFRNDTHPAGHWLALELHGRASSPDAIGTLIEADIGALTLRRQVKGGSSAHSQDSLTVHFGLGEATKVDTLRIFWPSGHTNTLSDVAADQRLSVIEDLLFANGFESGDFSAWTSSP